MNTSVIIYKGREEGYESHSTVGDINWSIERPNWLRYEFTTTFNPKWYCSPQDAADEVPRVIKAIATKAMHFIGQNDHIYLNYVVEYQKNGMPHVHGTLMTEARLTNVSMHNWEQFLNRYYGKSQIWFTGSGNKFHKNDHFEGSWQQYLIKDNPENYRSLIIFKKNVVFLENAINLFSFVEV